MTDKKQIPVAGTKPAPQVYFRIDRPEPRVVDDAPNWRDRVREIVTPIWFDYHGTHFFDGDGKMIAQIRGWGGLTSSGLSDEEARQVQEKNAAFIVNAVNEYDALVAENEALKEMLADVMLVEGKAWSISDNGNPAKLIALRQYDDEGNLLSYTHHNSVLEALTILAAHGGNDE